MKKGTFNFIEQILIDYTQTEKHIAQRIQELKYPMQQPDENIGGGKSSFTSNVPERLAVTLADDMLLTNLKRNHDIVTDVLQELEPNARQVIELYYINSPRLYTWTGVSEKTRYSEKQCRNIRNIVFEKIAKRLGMII